MKPVKVKPKKPRKTYLSKFGTASRFVKIIGDVMPEVLISGSGYDVLLTRSEVRNLIPFLFEYMLWREQIDNIKRSK
jgi:hypothetical protein